MIQPWKLIDNGKPVDGLPWPIEAGVLAYLAYINAHRVPGENIVVVDTHEATRSFLAGVVMAGSDADWSWLIANNYAEVSDVHLWFDCVIERLEIREQLSDY